MTRQVEVVDSGVIEVRYKIQKYTWTHDGKSPIVRYDWATESGEDADQFFDTIEEATADVEAVFG